MTDRQSQTMNTQVTDSQVTSAQEGSLVLLKTKATWLATHLCTTKKFPKKGPDSGNRRHPSGHSQHAWLFLDVPCDPKVAPQLQPCEPHTTSQKRASTLLRASTD